MLFAPPLFVPIVGVDHPIDPLTRIAFIDGRQIDLDNHQKQLYRKFKAKYDGQESSKN